MATVLGFRYRERRLWFSHSHDSRLPPVVFSVCCELTQAALHTISNTGRRFPSSRMAAAVPRSFTMPNVRSYFEAQVLLLHVFGKTNTTCARFLWRMPWSLEARKTIICIADFERPKVVFTSNGCFWVKVLSRYMYGPSYMRWCPS